MLGRDACSTETSSLLELHVPHQSVSMCRRRFSAAMPWFSPAITADGMFWMGLCCFWYVDACRSALCVEVYLKMDRPDKAEQQAKVGREGGGELHVVVLAGVGGFRQGCPQGVVCMGVLMATESQVP